MNMQNREDGKYVHFRCVLHQVPSLGWFLGNAIVMRQIFIRSYPSRFPARSHSTLDALFAFEKSNLFALIKFAVCINKYFKSKQAAMAAKTKSSFEMHLDISTPRSVFSGGECLVALSSERTEREMTPLELYSIFCYDYKLQRMK